MTDPVLSIDGLAAGYGDILVIEDVTVTVPAGAVVAIVGPNGAGKSTLLKAVYGQAAVRSGRITYRPDGTDRDITGLKAFQLTALGLNFVPQLDNVFAALTVAENLEIGATTRRRGQGAGLQRVYDVFPPLLAKRRQRAGTLSGGQRQMLALGRALMSEPGLLLLDEPSAGLAPQAVDEMFGLIGRVRRLGVTVLLVEQNARRALAIADYGYVLETGRNRYQATGAELLADPRVAELYLGGRHTAVDPIPPAQGDTS